MTKQQFDLLSILATTKEKLTQHQLQKISGYSDEITNQLMQTLTKWGYAKNCAISPDGLLALEPYRVKRAIFMAAGFGKRMVPVTLNTAKPLVRVHGVRMIDTLIDACLNAGIKEIYIVRGYLAEQFDQLLYKYPMIKFIENPAFNEANNISSAMVARYFMQNTYIFESDLMISNPAIITKYHYQSDVLGIWKEETADWCLDVDEKGFVIEEKIGGSNTYQMVGIYYFNGDDGKRLAKHIEETYLSPGGKERYWETIPNQIYKGQYHIAVRPCQDEDVIEIDSFSELKSIDPVYNVL